jgi:acyl carrier protein
MNTDSQFETKVLSLIVETVPRKFKKTAITGETHLQKELGLDSIAILAMVFRFEEVFKIDLGRINFQVNMGELRTVNDALKMSKEILEQAGSLRKG